MSKIDKNFVKKELKINTENFGFSFSHHKKKSTNFLNINKKAITTPKLNTNHNINNHFKNNNINIININISNNCNTANKKKNNNTNFNFNNNTLKNLFINDIKKKNNLNQKYDIQKRTKLETSPNNDNIINDNKNNKKIKKDEKNFSSRPETEINIRKNSFSNNKNKKKAFIPLETSKHMIISYLDFKNILTKKNMKIEYKKKENLPKTEKIQNKREKFIDINKGKQKILNKYNSNINKNLKNSKHQSEVNLLRFKNNYIYYNNNIKQSKSLLNKHKFNSSNNDNSNIDKVKSFGHIKTSENLEKENNKRIKHYYTKNEKKNNCKNKRNNKDIIINHDKNNSLNYSILPSSSLINISDKSKILSNSYFFQKHIHNERNNDSDLNDINISNIKRNKSNLNNEINKKINLGINTNKICRKKNFLIFDESNIYQNKNTENKNNNISLEELFDNKFFKNPEELHFFCTKFVQVCKETSLNF